MIDFQLFSSEWPDFPLVCPGSNLASEALLEIEATLFIAHKPDPDSDPDPATPSVKSKGGYRRGGKPWSPVDDDDDRRPRERHRLCNRQQSLKPAQDGSR